MRKVIYVFVVITLLMQACVDQGSDDIDYRIFNQTNKNVKVLGFNKQLAPNTNGIADAINIAPNSIFKVTRITGFDDNTGKVYYSFIGVDSVRVIFNNEKVKVYTRESVRNTPDASVLDGDSDHNHFITEEDYNSAIDCNGDCE